MTPPDDRQEDNPNKPEFEGTIKLMRCGKHGTYFYVGESCAECEKEKDSPDERASG